MFTLMVLIRNSTRVVASFDVLDYDRDSEKKMRIAGLKDSNLREFGNIEQESKESNESYKTRTTFNQKLLDIEVLNR